MESSTPDWLKVYQPNEFEIEFVRQAQESAKRVSKQVTSVHADMAVIWPYILNLGWYAPPSAIRVGGERQLRAMVDSRDDASIHQLMDEGARGRVGEVLRVVQESYPLRVRLVKRAIEAHVNKDYLVSIPLFIAQADGMCYEMLGVSFTSRNSSKNPRTRVDAELVLRTPQTVSVEEDISTRAFLEGLRHYAIVSQRTADRDAQRAVDPAYNPLNRHGVQHGLDIDYDNERNSLQALLMVEFMASIKGFI